MIKWTNEVIGNSIREFMSKNEIVYMPTSQELRVNDSGLGRAIGLTGGFGHWAEELNLPRKEKVLKWSDSLVKEEISKSIKTLGIDRMPTAEELKSIGRNDLHCHISKTKKYSGWAHELELELKRSETKLGQEWEKQIADFLTRHEYDVELMTTRHPYDLLVDKTVKVDVKVANPYLLRGSRVHTFALHKVKPTCDIYILIALDEQGKRERTLIIPSHLVQMKMINIGRNSKYNRFNNDWLMLYTYSKFFNGIK